MKILSIAELIEKKRADEIQHIKDYIRECGGDGLCDPGECGCGLGDLCPCGESPVDLVSCYPAKGKPGEWEGMKCTVYYKIVEADDAK